MHEHKVGGRSLTVLLVLSLLYCGAYVSCNIAAQKLTQIGFFTVPAVIFVFWFVVQLLDIINEFYGWEVAFQVATISMIVNIIVSLLLLVAVYLPPSPVQSPELHEWYFRFFTWSPRITLASVVAYLISTYVDTKIFDYLKKITKRKHFWLRENISTAVSQLIDSTLFIHIAFLGTIPYGAVLYTAVCQYSFKMLINVLDTPLMYLYRYLVSRALQQVITVPKPQLIHTVQ
ncbi:MAG: hypothetical protein DRJ40_02460 [Thermoprotei archaeon]|nr:MAG: hypothetical protein DRJ40_02460 [Thermoprotei archaeon]